MTPSSKQKGDLLELLVARFCSGIANAKVEHNVKLPGRSGALRQVDTLITGNIGAFEVRILVDAKNHADPIDINIVEALLGLVDDVGANLGIIVCPGGFTEGAKKRAVNENIELDEFYDSTLGNTNLLIPLRLIEARLESHQFRFTHTSSTSGFTLPNQSRWELHIDGNKLRPVEVPFYLWNKHAIPQERGEYEVVVGAIKLTDSGDPNNVQYCELTVKVWVVEDYYLKFFPASFLRKGTGEKKSLYDLRADIYSKKDDMLKNGWVYFATQDEMDRAADIENQAPDIKGLIIRPNYTIRLDAARSLDHFATARLR